MANLNQSRSLDPEDLVSLDELEPKRPLPHFEFLTGPAGSGKSFNVMGRVRENPSYGVVCSTTGVSAVNLGAGVTTINSLLHYFDYESLKDNYVGPGNKLNRRLIEISEEDKVDHIVLDEISMMPGPNLELITSALLEVNQHLKKPLGMVLTGDYCQLPPVKAPWAFETLDDKGRVIPSSIWEKYFAPNTVRLNKIWRQSDPLFLEALNGFRRGDGKAGAEALFGTCARFENSLDTNFDGTTILARNDEVDRFNFLRLTALKGPAFNLNSYRWAREPHLMNQWREIPEKVTLKRGALVMILANRPPEFEYVNGDLATVEEFDSPSRSLILALKRNGEEIYLPPLLRKTHQRETPEIWRGIRPRPRSRKDAIERAGEASYWDPDAEKWVVGEIYYYPVRLGWATTVHKCVAPGSLIPIADRGLVPVEFVQCGDLVDTGNGLQPVKQIWLTAPKPTVRITTRRGLTLLMSREHPIKTSDGHFKVGISPGDEIEVWKPNLTLGETCACALPESERTKRGAELNTPCHITPNLAWAMGALVGDGSYREVQTGLIEFHASDENLHEKLRVVLAEHGVRLKRRSNKLGSWAVHKGFRLWLRKLGLDFVRSECKSVPWPILRSGRRIQCEFLRGLFDTDGSMTDRKSGKYRTPSLVYTTSSRILAEQVHILILAQGIPVSKGEQNSAYTKNGRKTATGNKSFQLRIPHIGYEQFSLLVGFSRESRKEPLKKVIERFSKKPPRDLFHAKLDEVSSVVDIGVSIPMYDLEVEGQHSFVANGFICHNSQSLSLDRVQVDARNGFFRQPGLCYVSVSRCRTPEGLRIVGSPKLLEERCRIDEKVRPWL